jgi:hypothetical protein
VESVLKFYTVGGQIDQLLLASWRPRTQHRNWLIAEFEQQEREKIDANERAAIEADATADLTQKLHRARRRTQRPE